MDPLSVIASTIAVIQAIPANRAIQNIHDLPNEFKEVGAYLPLVPDTLKVVERRIRNAGLDEASKKAIRPLVLDCATKVKELQKMYTEMEGQRGKAVDSYRSLLIQLGKENRVETLMQGILVRLKMIADNQAMRGATHSQVAKLNDALAALSEVESSVSDADLDRAGTYITQNIADTATGNQAVNTGSGITNANFGGHNYYSGGGDMSFVYNENPNAKHEADNKKQRNGILTSLSVQDYQTAKERNRDRVPGTCEWFASHQLFRTWKDSASPSMLWVSADPGCGKSVLAKHLVNTVLPTTDTRTTCYFFFKDDFEDQKPARNALCCLLHQLLLARKQVFSDEILERFETSSQSTSSLQYLWDTFVLAASSQHAGEVVCILDAYDECQLGDQRPFAQILRRFYDKSPSNPNLKFLITSRPYESIRQGFQSSDGSRNPIIHLKGDNEEEVAKISKEIDIFIDAEIKHVKRDLHLSPEEQQRLLRAIRAVPHRTYLWVYLTLDWINKEIGFKKYHIEDIASHLPETVDDAYEKILSRIPDSHRSEAKKLLHIIVAAARPLTLQEIDEAVAVERHHKSHSELNLQEGHIEKYVRGICGLFVTIIDSRVYLLHQTAKEFLQPKDKDTTTPDDRKWKHSLQPQKSENVLFQACAAYLLLSEINVVEYLSVSAAVKRHPFLEYASTNWALHHRSSGSHDTDTAHSLIYQLSKEGSTAFTEGPLWFRVSWLKKDTECPYFFTPLMAAAYFGLENSVELLLKEGKQQAKLTSKPCDRTALSWASENGFSRIVRLLIPHPTRYRLKAALSPFSHSMVNEQDSEGMTPLHYAALNGHGDIVDLLVKAGADGNVRDLIDATPLTYALISQHHDTFQKLQKEILEEDVRNTLTDLLVSAVESDRRSIVRQLLALGTIDVVPLSTRLLFTVMSAEVVHLLIDAGASIEATDGSGNTPLHWAATRHLGPSHHAGKVVRALLDRGADVEAVNKAGNTPLHEAAMQYDGEVSLEALLHRGADVKAVNLAGDTPLHCAIRCSERESIQTVLFRGADIEAVNLAGETPRSMLESRRLGYILPSN